MRRATLASIAILPWLVSSAFPTEADPGAPGPRGKSALDRGEARVVAELLVDADSVAAGDRVRIGVLLGLDPGWHVYWRNPGDSGSATELTWRAPDAEIGPIQWPAPQIFREAEGLLTTFGYEADVLLASDAVVSKGAQGTWHLEVDTAFVACLIECIPGRIRLAREVPVTVRGAPPPPAIRDRFDLAASRLPRTPESLDVVVEARASHDAAVAGDDVALVLEVVSCVRDDADCRPWTLDATYADQAFVPEVVSNLGLSALGLSHPPTAPTDGARGFSLVFTAHAFEDEPHIDRQRLRGVLPLARADGTAHLAVDVPIARTPHTADGASAAAFEVIAALPSPPRDGGLAGGAAPDSATPMGVGAPSLGIALVLGLLGGLILNLMPCVLPVSPKPSAATSCSTASPI